MKISETEIEGLFDVTLEQISDSRGFFVRSYCLKELSTYKKDITIVQINHSMTVEKGLIRGMHYQLPPFCETKFIRCIRGAVFDVAVDLRRNSPTYLKWHCIILKPGNMKMLIIPEGFAHGFQTLEENCEMLYFHTQYYNRDYEAGVNYNDPKIKIEWILPVASISEKDRNYPFIDSSFKAIEL